MVKLSHSDYFYAQPYVTDPIATDTERRKVFMAKGSVRKKGKKWYYRFYVENESGNLVQKEYAGTESVPFPVSWTVKMKKKQKETQDILSYHTQAAGCSDKARAKASGGRQPIEECGRTGL